MMNWVVTAARTVTRCLSSREMAWSAEKRGINTVGTPSIVGVK